MARNLDLTGRIRLDGADKVEGQLDDIADKAEQVEKPVELDVDADVRNALDALDRLDQEARATAVAAEELGRALGPELTARVNMDGLITELKNTGLTIEQITTNADQLADKLRQVDSDDLGGGLGRAMGTAKGKTEELADSARGANSAMANMIGNSVQDLGALSGVAGSAGVAIGQMAEYAADARLAGEGLGSALGSMAKVAGPIAGLAFAMQLMGDAANAAKASNAFDAANVQQYFDALREGTAIVNSFNEEIRETGELQFRAAHGGGFLGMFSSTKDLLPVLERANVLVSEFNAIVDEYVAAGDGSAEANDRWRASLEARGVSELDAIAIVKAANQEADARAEALARQQRTAEALGTTVEELAAAEKLAEGITKAATMAQEEQARAAEEQKLAMEQAALAAQEYAAIVGGNDWGAASLEGATAGAEAFARAQFGLVNIAADAEAAYDGLNAAIEANGYTFDLNTEAGRANSAALQELYQTTVPAMAKAYADAGGDLDTFTRNMDAVREGVMAQLREETSLTEEQIADLVAQMGLIPENARTQFELMGAEDANAKLALLSGVLSSLPPDVQRKVTLAVLADDPQAALAAIQTAVGDAPPVALSTTADMSGAAEAVEGFASGDQPTTTVDAEANMRPAEQDVDSFTRERRETQPVKVDANTAAAIATMQLLYTLAQILRPIVTVTADTFPARLALAGVGQITVRPRVEAYLADYPTASEIAARIGVVRVPVDGYVRHVPRIDGGG
jgi:hypothetical protein